MIRAKIRTDSQTHRARNPIRDRAEREALSLIHFLRDQGEPQSEWLNALSSDQTLSEPVRQRALQFACEWKP